ncbi:ATP-binding protein [Solirubrobacter sp. CPCC 204708]|uniref:ATP-binding protein n=1 Tax=Solirubrobacter deserti TaxID=2282478 RepID=A0ABT4RUV6_9ACTN|nr:ATP-binding protein [Solirubrobacter deserti]MBE2317935.1 ATP-binding protein [Solirubrobacter deserti]MDA0142277.1 ATP-binding protein [Solirubrobacter deserti]
MSTVVEATLLDVDLPAEPRSASQARRAVLNALSGIAVDKDAVGVVVSEAVTNAVVHAYRDRDVPGRVHVSASLDDHGVEVAVDDDGLGMRPRVDSPGVGLGLPLMGDLADRVDITSRDPGTRIAAFFALMGPAGPHGRPLARHMSGRAERRLAHLV